MNPMISRLKSTAIASFLLFCIAPFSSACTQIIISGKGSAYPKEVMSSRSMTFSGEDSLRVRTLQKIAWDLRSAKL